MRGVLAERAVAGQSRINALLRAKEDGGTDWRELSDALPHVRAWAVTSMSARRFPTDPGQFDLVIIDEAGQYTIPSIVPLLFRAKRSLVIGDPVVFSLVADRYQSPRSFDWADRRQDLWNVAITRARSQLVVVGDGKVWDRHGGVSTELRLAAQDAVTYTGTSGLADELTERLYDALSTVPGAAQQHLSITAGSGPSTEPLGRWT